MPVAGPDEADGRVTARDTPRVVGCVRVWRRRDEVVIGYGTEPLTVLSLVARRESRRLRAGASAGQADPRDKSFSGMQIYHMAAGRRRACSKDFCKFPADGYH
jgi:hypothetical protein